MSQLLGLLLLAVIFGAFGYLIWRTQKIERRRLAGYVDLAARRGLEHEFRPSRNDSPAEIRFTDRDAGLVLVVIRRKSTKSPSSTTTTTRDGSTMVSLPEPRFPGGMAVYSPALDTGLAAAAGSVLGAFDNPVAKMLIGKFAGDDIGAYLGQLDAQPVPDGVALTIMASADPNPIFDARAVERALNAVPGPAQTERQAMVMITETGFRIRVSTDLNEPADIEALLDIALALQTDLRN